MVARSFQVFLITFLVLKPSLACLEAEIYLYLRLKIVFRQSSLQPSSYFLGHPVSQIRYHIWDKSEQQQSAGRLSFIYAGEGQADDEGIPGKGISNAADLQAGKSIQISSKGDFEQQTGHLDWNSQERGFGVGTRVSWP